MFCDDILQTIPLWFTHTKWTPFYDWSLLPPRQTVTLLIDWRNIPRSMNWFRTGGTYTIQHLCQIYGGSLKIHTSFHRTIHYQRSDQRRTHPCRNLGRNLIVEWEVVILRRSIGQLDKCNGSRYLIWSINRRIQYMTAMSVLRFAWDIWWHKMRGESIMNKYSKNSRNIILWWIKTSWINSRVLCMTFAAVLSCDHNNGVTWTSWRPSILPVCSTACSG